MVCHHLPHQRAPGWAFSPTAEQEAGQLQPRPAASAAPRAPRAAVCQVHTAPHAPSTTPRPPSGPTAGVGAQAGDAQGSDPLILPPSKQP